MIPRMVLAALKMMCVDLGGGSFAMACWVFCWQGVLLQQHRRSSKPAVICYIACQAAFIIRKTSRKDRHIPTGMM